MDTSVKSESRIRCIIYMRVIQRRSLSIITVLEHSVALSEAQG